MPSTSKTANLSLSQWEATDGVCREDFNADNAIIDAALGAVPVFKLKAVTTSAATQTVEIDLSDIDMTAYSELWIDVRLGKSYASGNSAYFRLNNISTAVYGYTYTSGMDVYQTTGSNTEPLYSGMYKFSLGDQLCWSVPLFAGSGMIAASALVPAAWTSITFYINSDTFPAGGKIRIYGVKKL
jgi:hypothetical protein